MFLSVFQNMTVQFSRLVVSNSLWPHEPQHVRPPCPSPTPRVYPNSCSLSWWCHPTISSSVILFSSRLQSFPASGSFQMSQLFSTGGQRIRVSASASVLPMNAQDWSPLGWTGWISLQCKGCGFDPWKGSQDSTSLVDKKQNVKQKQYCNRINKYFKNEKKKKEKWKDPDAGKDWRQEEKGMTEDEMVGWYYRLNVHEFE